MNIDNTNWNRTSYKITWYSFFLSLMIVSYHTYNVSVYNLENTTGMFGKILFYLETYISGVQSIAVPSFFMISGFLFYKTFKIHELWNKYKSRFFSLVIPYIIWNTLAFLFFAILTHSSFFAANMNMSAVDLSIQGILTAILMGKYNALWFVRVLIILVILSPLLYFFIRNKIVGCITLTSVIIIHWFMYENEFTILYGSLFFLFGGYISINYFELAVRKYSTITFRVSLLFSIIISFSLSNQWVLSYTPIRQIVLLFFCILGWIIFDNIRLPKHDQWWLKTSFFIFCIHGIILESIEKLMLLYIGNNTLGAAVSYIFSPLIVLLIIMGVAYILKNKFPKTWRVLNGNRI